MAEHPRHVNRTLPLRILYLGRIYREQKRVHLFPKILEMLQKSGIPFQWTIAGEGHDRVELEPLMRSPAPHQRVEFIGPVSYSDVGKILNTHDVYLLASDYEGLPLSMLEAMGNGLVPVVSDLESGIRDVVDAGNGTLVSINDVEGYAQAIIHLHQHRDELAVKSAAAKARVQTEFSVGAMTDRWLQVLPMAVASKEWPRRFAVRGVLTDPGQWKYHPLMRPFRRLLKRI
jgi:glycosyltransferase involved in cell wall biosynthesis